MAQTILFSIDGSDVKIDAVGFKGKQCEITKAYEQGLGVVKERKAKPEFYQTTSLTQKVGS